MDVQFVCVQFERVRYPDLTPQGGAAPAGSHVRAREVTSMLFPHNAAGTLPVPERRTCPIHKTGKVLHVVTSPRLMAIQLRKSTRFVHVQPELKRARADASAASYAAK